MKNKIVLLLIGFLLAGVNQGKAQSKARQQLAAIAAKKTEREKQLAHLHTKVNEQKGQLQHEKKTERNIASARPEQQEKTQGSGVNGPADKPGSAASKERGRKNETASD